MYILVIGPEMEVNTVFFPFEVLANPQWSGLFAYFLTCLVGLDRFLVEGWTWKLWFNCSFLIALDSRLFARAHWF